MNKQDPCCQHRLLNSRIQIVAVLSPFLVFFAFCSLSIAAGEIGAKPEKTDVIVTYAQPSGSFGPIYVAYEAGLFKKYGLDAKLQVLNPQISAQDVISGEADFYTDGPDLINARLKGARVKYFGVLLKQFVFQIWGAKDITSIRQLKGKTVAVSTPRAAIDTATREALKRNGLVPGSDVKVLYVQTVPAILTAVTSGKTFAGTLSAPATLQAQAAGLNLLVDIAQLNIPGLHNAYGTTERYFKNNPNTIYAFLKAVAEGVALSRRDPSLAKETIAKYARISDSKILDGAYDQFAPYWATDLSVPVEAVKSQLSYLPEKEFPEARNADPREFFDNSFVQELERSGFFKKIGLEK